MADINNPNYPYSAVADENTDFSGNARANTIDDLIRTLAAAIAPGIATLFANDVAINTQLEGMPGLLSADKFRFNALCIQSVEVGTPIWISAVAGSALTASTEVPEGRLPQAFAISPAAAGSIGAFSFADSVLLTDLTGFTTENTIVYLDFDSGSWALTLAESSTSYRVGGCNSSWN